MVCVVGCLALEELLITTIKAKSALRGESRRGRGRRRERERGRKRERKRERERERDFTRGMRTACTRLRARGCAS